MGGPGLCCRGAPDGAGDPARCLPRVCPRRLRPVACPESRGHPLRRRGGAGPAGALFALRPSGARLGGCLGAAGGAAGAARALRRRASRAPRAVLRRGPGTPSRLSLASYWPRLATAGIPVLLQQLIPGPETCIESYHVYVDEHGETVGEFTGRKIRTWPPAHGDSTALVITDSPEVTTLGRDLVRRLDLRGVAKFDFKRAPDCRMYLLEINPRFTLWHHLGARAGVNIPALVYADLAGLPRAGMRQARAGARWCKPWGDVSAAAAAGISFLRWLPWALSCEAMRVVAWDDPIPFVRGVLWRVRFPVVRLP